MVEVQTWDFQRNTPLTRGDLIALAHEGVHIVWWEHKRSLTDRIMGRFGTLRGDMMKLPPKFLINADNTVTPTVRQLIDDKRLNEANAKIEQLTRKLDKANARIATLEAREWQPRQFGRRRVYVPETTPVNPPAPPRK